MDSSPQSKKSGSDIGQSPSKADNLPSWAEFHLKKCNGRVESSCSVIMGHYLVVLVRDVIVIKKYDDDESKRTVTLLAFNLQDHTVQEATGIDENLFIPQRDHYGFFKCCENQILKYGRGYERDLWNYAVSMIYITVESFERNLLIFCKEIPKRNKAFKVKCEKVLIKNERISSVQTAQIYKDTLYSYQKENELWSFDLSNQAWKLCETTGEVPKFTGDNDDGLVSFIDHDILYIYGVTQGEDNVNLFMLNLSSMTWKKIAQHEKYLGARDVQNRVRFGGTVYQGHLVTLENFINSKENRLCFLNLQTQNAWSTFEIKGINEWARIYHDYDQDPLVGNVYPEVTSLMTYKNSVLSMSAPSNNRNLILAIMDIENFGISAPKSAEEEYESGLFLSQNESDVTFKIQDQVIHVHKKILMKKSKYFAGLFHSHMAESKQDIIEIKDCEYNIFIEYLRWIYQGTVNTKDTDQATKLYILADKYVQEDLQEKCLVVLTSRLNMENVYTILDFAQQENIISVESWCLKTFKDKLTVNNVTGLIKYLDLEPHENKKGFRNQAFNFVLDNFFAIYDNEKGNDIQIYQEFLLKNIEIDTISPLVRFVGRRKEYLSIWERVEFNSSREEENESKRRKKIFEKSTVELKEAVFSFIEGNTQVIMASQVAKDISNDLLKYVTSYTAEKKKILKRMESSQNNGFDGKNQKTKK